MQNSKNIVANNRGFSLIEMMITGGVAAILALGLSQMLSGFARNTKNAEVLTEAKYIKYEVMGVLRIPKSCKQNFAGLSIPSGAGAKLSLSNINLFDSGGSVSSTVMRPGDKVNGIPQLTVDTLTAESFVQVSTTPPIYSFSIVAKFKKTDPASGYIVPANMVIPYVTAKTTGTSIDDCTIGDSLDLASETSDGSCPETPVSTFGAALSDTRLVALNSGGWVYTLPKGFPTQTVPYTGMLLNNGASAGVAGSLVCSNGVWGVVLSSVPGGSGGEGAAPGDGGDGGGVGAGP